MGEDRIRQSNMEPAPRPTRQTDGGFPCAYKRFLLLFPLENFVRTLGADGTFEGLNFCAEIRGNYVLP